MKLVNMEKTRCPGDLRFAVPRIQGFFRVRSGKVLLLKSWAEKVGSEPAIIRHTTSLSALVIFLSLTIIIVIHDDVHNMPEPSPVLTPSTDPPLLRRLSSSSVFSLAEPGTLTPKSSTSIQFAEGDVQVVTEEGLPHATIKLHARYVPYGLRIQLKHSSEPEILST